MSTSTVFISYSHKDETWKDKLIPQLHALERAGVPMRVWHDRKIDGGERWYPEIQEAMANAAVALLLISPDFLASGFITKEEVPYLLERQEKDGMLLIPVLVRRCPWKAHRWLADRQMIPRDGKCVAIDFPGDQADAVFSDVAEAVHAHFSRLAARAQTASSILTGVRPMAQPEGPPLDPGRVDLSHLPETGSALFGRDDVLNLLDRAWGSQGSDVRVLAFKAQGGVGKSTLIKHWLEGMRRDHFRGATRVFGWSFYSQGVREQGAPSADAFVAAALRFFGDEAMAASAASPWDKGQRLARLAGAERALLILDGMEPLQSAQAVDRGKLREPALESLLRGLAKQSAGLCLITTRESLAELGNESGVAEHDLEQITPQAGRALLRTMHITGTDTELESLAARFGPHALAVSLLGVYLREQPGRRIGPATALEQIPGKTPVYRVLAGIETWLGPSAELETLRLLGLFDRPADDGCLHALRSKPAIPGLTELLVGMTDTDWSRVLARLDKLRLIHVRLGDTGKRFVDAHPIIREHFAEQLQEKDLEAWRAAHRRLYEHLCATTKEGDQPKLGDLQPLYQAVKHGCLAGLQQEACDETYFARIIKENEHYSWRKLGSFGSDLGAVACFFEQPWRRPSTSLKEADQAWLLGQAAIYLRALGRLTEALEPMRAGLEMRIEQENWKAAAIVAGNLSELELTLGEVAVALGDAEQSVTYADRSSDAAQRILSGTTHADALHQADRRDEAETRFREAEQMQQEMQPDYPLLHSLEGFRYCDLLLAAPERAAWQALLGRKTEDFKLETLTAVSRRAERALDRVLHGSRDLLGIALNHLTLGRAAFYAAIREGSASRPRTSDLSHIDDAVSGLRRAGTQHHLPRALLTCAWQRFLEGKRTGPGGAQENLDEAWEIAERGAMKLFLADIHLYRARLFFHEGEYPWNKNPDGSARGPRDDLDAAAKLIRTCGYHRRDEELAVARAVIGMERHQIEQ